MKKSELTLTKAWQENSPYLVALSPLSALYGAIGSVRKSLYYNDILKKYHAPVPVLVIGNITVGGSGKTPLIIALVRYLQSQKINVGVISRGYGRASGEAVLVDSRSTPAMAGDEPCLIVQSTNVPMAVGADRKEAIELLLKNHNDIRFIISDDGLQHYRLHRDAEWIVVDAMRGFGNQKLLPQGFLREPISRLEGADVIFHDNAINKYTDSDMTMHLSADTIEPLFANDALAVPAKNDKIYAVSGIGYPKRFFATLTDLGFDVVPRPFADHHDFKLSDFAGMEDLPIIITSKDAVKIKEMFHHEPNSKLAENIWVLPVNAKLSSAVYAKMDKLLSDFAIR